MFKDKDGFEYEETPEHMFMTNWLKNISDQISKTKEEAIEEMKKYKED